MTSIINQFEIGVLEIFNVFDIRINLELREWVGISLQLFLQWLNMIFVHVRIPQTVDKLSTLKTTGLS